MYSDPMARFEALQAKLDRSRAEALARLEQVRRHDGVRPGDVYCLEAGDAVAYVVVVAARAAGERWLVVLADDHGALRPDLDLRTTPRDGVSLSIRTDRRLELPASMLPARARLALLTRGTLTAARQLAELPRTRPAPRPHDLSLHEALLTLDEALRTLRATAGGPTLPLREAPPPKGAARGAVEAAALAGLAGDGGPGDLLRAAATNQPTCFVLQIDGDDALSAVSYPRDGVYLRYRGAPHEAPEVRGVYCDHERVGRWEPTDDVGVAATSEAFPWEDDSVELRIGAVGYVVRVTRPVARRDREGGAS